jgi:hypothetical protein
MTTREGLQPILTEKDGPNQIHKTCSDGTTKVTSTLKLFDYKGLLKKPDGIGALRAFLRSNRGQLPTPEAKRAVDHFLEALAEFASAPGVTKKQATALVVEIFEKILLRDERGCTSVPRDIMPYVTRDIMTRTAAIEKWLGLPEWPYDVSALIPPRLAERMEGGGHGGGGHGGKRLRTEGGGQGSGGAAAAVAAGGGTGGVTASKHSTPAFCGFCGGARHEKLSDCPTRRGAK